MYYSSKVEEPQAEDLSVFLLTDPSALLEGQGDTKSLLNLLQVRPKQYCMHSSIHKRKIKFHIGKQMALEKNY